MKISVYWAEKYDRNKLRYIVFSIVFSWVIILSIFTKNVPWAILLFFLLWWYFYFSVSNRQIIDMEITNDWLKIWNRIYNRILIKWYVLEVDIKTQKLKNIVIVFDNNHYIHTLADSEENIKNFVITLNDFIQMLKEYKQTSMELFIRKLKL